MYKQLTSEQRYYIYTERQKGSTQKSIAKAIGVSESAVSREVKRNGGKNGSYNFMKAQADDALRRLKALIEPMVEHHARAMGVKPSVVYYKAMISRWGVCHVRDKAICFSAYLLLLPAWCVEHVVVHELCHLLEPSHNARFHALMDKYFPRWKEARRQTRQIQAKTEY